MSDTKMNDAPAATEELAELKRRRRLETRSAQTVGRPSKWVAIVTKPSLTVLAHQASVFPEELYEAPRSLSERGYPKLIHYNRPPRGGHFAACEPPELLTQEIRAGLRSLR